MKNFIKAISVILMLSMLLCGCSEPAPAVKTDHDFCMDILNGFVSALKSSDSESAKSFFNPAFVKGHTATHEFSEDEVRAFLLDNSTKYFPAKITGFTLISEAEADSVPSNRNVTFFDKELEQYVIDNWPDGITGYYCDKYPTLAMLIDSVENSHGYTPEKFFVITADVSFDDGSSQYLDFIFDLYEGEWHLWGVWESI